MSDYDKIIEHSLRDLYIKMADVYTESIKSDITVNPEIQDFFASADILEGTLEIEKNLKSPETIELMLLRFDYGEALTFTDQQSIITTLISQYDKYGMEYPPDDFLHLHSGADQWWKTKSVTKNGYFINVDVLKVDKGKKSVFFKGKEYKSSWPLDFENLMATDNLQDALIESAKKEYFGALVMAPPEENTMQLSEGDILDSYFLILDQDANSFHF